MSSECRRDESLPANENSKLLRELTGKEVHTRMFVTLRFSPRPISPETPLRVREQVLLNEDKTPTSRAMKRGYLSSQSWFDPAVSFAVYTGIRRAEVLALRWSDLSFETGSVTIARSIAQRLEFKPPKNDRSRAITMPQTLCAILKTHRANQAKERLFLGNAL